MSLLMPTIALRKVTDITPEMLKNLGTDAILLDVDNTLAPPDSKIPYEGVQEWIKMIKASGIHIVICSNNFKKRIKPFSDSIGLDCVAMSLKPFPFGFNRAKRKLKEKPNSVLVVGDQIYTDVLGANLAGMKAILLLPRSEEHGWSIWLRNWRKMRTNSSLRKTSATSLSSASGQPGCRKWRIPCWIIPRRSAMIMRPGLPRSRTTS